MYIQWPCWFIVQPMTEKRHRQNLFESQSKDMRRRPNVQKAISGTSHAMLRSFDRSEIMNVLNVSEKKPIGLKGRLGDGQRCFEKVNSGLIHSDSNS